MAGIFKAYDIRGIVPRQLDETIARRIGLSFQHVLDDEDRAHGNAVVVSRDMRATSPGPRGGADRRPDRRRARRDRHRPRHHADELLRRSATCKTAGGVQVTASHNPTEYNGFKFSQHGARPVSGDHGIALMEEKVQSGDLPEAARRGTVTQAAVFDDYAEHVLSFLKPGRQSQGRGRRRERHGDDRPLDPRARWASSWCRSTSSSTAPSPTTRRTRSKKRTSTTSSRLVHDSGADLGLAFDGDADRAAFVDEQGAPIGSDLMTGADRRRAADARARQGGGLRPALVAGGRRVPRASTAASPIRERVGHSFIKATLRRKHGLFGGELAGHYYFRDNFYADCPLLAVVEVLNLLRATGKPLSELIRPLQRYAKSPEINFEVEDKDGKIRELAERYQDAEIDYLDGITFQYPTWWANVRPSNTEPYLRLVLEASTPEELAERRAEIQGMLGEPAE